MPFRFRQIVCHPALALASTLLAGLLELIALQAAQRARNKES